MSDDEDELQMDSALDMSMDGHDMMGFGPLLPTESERTLMERVRQELKIELKQVVFFNPARPITINLSVFAKIKMSFSLSLGKYKVCYMGQVMVHVRP